jgi:FecR protein
MSNILQLPLTVRITRRKLVVELLAVSNLTPRAVAGTTTNAAATVMSVSGSCTAGGRKLKRGDVVDVGDTVDAPTASSKLKLEMTDGSVISVAPASRLIIVSCKIALVTSRVGRPAGGTGSGPRERPAGRDVKLSLSLGLLRAVVSPAGGPSTFHVTTPAVGYASARSTDFFVEAKSDAVQIGVYEGTVDLTSAVTGRSVAIPTRWGGRLEAGRDPMPPRKWAQAEFDNFISRTE